MLWRGWAWKKRRFGRWRLRWTELDESALSWYRYVHIENTRTGQTLLGSVPVDDLLGWTWERCDRGVGISLALRSGQLVLVSLNPLARQELAVSFELLAAATSQGEVASPLTGFLSRVCVHLPLSLGVAAIHSATPAYAARAHSAAAVLSAAARVMGADVGGGRGAAAAQGSALTARMFWTRSLIPGPASLWAAQAEAISSLGPERLALVPFCCIAPRVALEDAAPVLEEDSASGRGGVPPERLACCLRRCPAGGGSHTHAHLLLVPRLWLPPVACAVPRALQTNDCYGRLLVAFVVHVEAGGLAWETVKRRRDFEALHEAVSARAATGGAASAALVELLSLPPSTALARAAFDSARHLAAAAFACSPGLLPWRALLPEMTRTSKAYRMSHGWPWRSAVALGLRPTERRRSSASAPEAAAAAAATAVAASAYSLSTPPESRAPSEIVVGGSGSDDDRPLVAIEGGGTSGGEDAGRHLVPADAATAPPASDAPDSPSRRLRRDWGAETVDMASLSARALVLPPPPRPRSRTHEQQQQQQQQLEARSLVRRLQYYFGSGGRGPGAGEAAASAAAPRDSLAGGGAAAAATRNTRSVQRGRSREPPTYGYASGQLPSSATPPVDGASGGGGAGAALSPYVRSNTSRDPSFEVRSFSGGGGGSRGGAQSLQRRRSMAQAVAAPSSVRVGADGAPQARPVAVGGSGGGSGSPALVSAFETLGLRRYEPVSAVEAEALELAAAVAASALPRTSAGPVGRTALARASGESTPLLATAGGTPELSSGGGPGEGRRGVSGSDAGSQSFLLQDTVRLSARVVQGTGGATPPVTPATPPPGGEEGVRAERSASDPFIIGAGASFASFRRGSIGGGSARGARGGAALRSRRRSLGRGRGSFSGISGDSLPSGGGGGTGSSEAAPAAAAVAAAAPAPPASRPPSFADARRLKCGRFVDALLSIPEAWADPLVLEWLGAMRRERSPPRAAAAAAAAAPSAAAPAPPARVLHIASAAAFLRPGDVVLFTCANTPATLQRVVTACSFDHVGIVVDAGWRDRVAAEERARADADAALRLGASGVVSPDEVAAPPSPASAHAPPSPAAALLPPRHRASSVVARFFGVPAAEAEGTGEGLEGGDRAPLLEQARGPAEGGGVRATEAAGAAGLATTPKAEPAVVSPQSSAAAHAAATAAPPAGALRLHLTASKALSTHRLSSADGVGFSAPSGGGAASDRAPPAASAAPAAAAGGAAATAAGHSPPHAWPPLPRVAHQYTLQLLESNSDGVRAYPLAQRLAAYGNGYCRAIAVRRLLLPFEEVLPLGREEEAEGGGTGGWGGYVPCGPACVMYARSRPPRDAHERGGGVSEPRIAAAVATPPRGGGSGGGGAPCPCAAASAWRAALERRLGAFLSEAVGAPYRLGPEKALQPPSHWAGRHAARPLPGAADALAAALLQWAGGGREIPPGTAPSAQPEVWSEAADAALVAAAPPRPHYYCSELLAVAYMRMGLLPPSSSGEGGQLALWTTAGPPAVSYWPNAWCAGSAVDCMLPLGCRLEAHVDVDPRGALPLQGAR